MSRTPQTPIEAAHVLSAYRRWAGVYDFVFGGVSGPARHHAVDAVNALPGARVLEMGVGTGLALPHYAPEKRVTGIDMSAEMLKLARSRVTAEHIGGVEALIEGDAEATGLPTASFDVAVAMFVASVVPNPRRLLAEMARVVRPGGMLLFVNHFAAAKGPRWWAERAMAPASRALGWHPDFAPGALMPPSLAAKADWRPMPPAGLFTLVALQRDAVGGVDLD